jgi:two-component system phosphate regulon response regulator PhoB
MRYDEWFSQNPSVMTDHDMSRVLVVDDEADLRDLVAFNLRQAGFAVETAGTGQCALDSARASHPAVVVLDLTLPDMLGTAVCAALREEPELLDVGILMFTACGTEDERITGLAHSRIARQVLNKPKTHRWNGIEIDMNRHRVTVDNVPLSLRRLEFKLLATLLPAAGTIFSRADLMRIIWGVEGQSDSRTVDTHVRRLRERLGGYGEAIETVVGLGYRWREHHVDA